MRVEVVVIDVVVLMRCAMGSRGFFRGVGPYIGSALLLQIRSDNMVQVVGILSLFCCHVPTWHK